jgi:hypothetical protein
MGIISRAADTYYTFRFIKTMVTPWEKMPAYEMGIIDENGNVLRKASTLTNNDEKAAYTVFHRLVFNVKRLLEKLPFGGSRLASYAAALFLIKEHSGLSNEQIQKALDKIMQQLEIDIDMSTQMNESNYWHVIDNDMLAPGTFVLSEDIASPTNGEIVARKGTRVISPGNNEPVDYMMGMPVYKVTHGPTKMDIFVTPGDLIR